MSNEIIDFDALEDVRQANIRESKHQFKRNGSGKFIIYDAGKLVIGYDATKGINLKAGNGVVVMGVLPVDDKRCTSGLLHGSVGKSFRSSTLEDAIVSNKIEANHYTFENPQEYQGIMYYRLTPVVVAVEQEFAEDVATIPNVVPLDAEVINTEAPAPPLGESVAPVENESEILRNEEF